MTPKWDHIIIHHSATSDSDTVSWQAIRRYHIDNQKWLDIGYHFGVEKINGHQEILLGRPLDQSGAHTKEQGMNRRGIGVCFVGDFDKKPPSNETLIYAAKYLVVPLMRYFSIPLKQIQPHRRYATYKTCPGQLFPWDAFITLIGARIGPARPSDSTT